MAIHNSGAAQNDANVNSGGTQPGAFGHDDAGCPLEGMAGRYGARGTEDDTTPAGNLFRLLPAQEQQNLLDNMSGPLSHVSAEIQARWLGHRVKADPACAAGVQAAIAARSGSTPNVG